MSSVSAIIFVLLTSLFSGEAIPAGSNSYSSDEERVTEQKVETTLESGSAIMPVTSQAMLEGNVE